MLDNFNFNLPTDLIAQTPIKDKSMKKMMVCQNGKIHSNKFTSILDFLQPQDVLVFNDVKVLKAKLYARLQRGDVSVEFNLDQEILETDPIADNMDYDSGLSYWMAICKGSKKLKEGDVVIFGDDFTAKVEKKLDDGFCILAFNKESFAVNIKKYGKIPLPPYIKRADDDVHNDEENYQTIYARNGAGVAAPTAGLHFDEDIFQELDKIGVKKVFVTLNVGAGTFLPVRTDNILDHKMHEEYYEISSESAQIINGAKSNGKRIIAVGTTSLRVLESSCDEDGKIAPFKGKTGIFIYPGYKFKIIDGLLTNFHLPKSTLFMLVCAFIGEDNAKRLYGQAIEEEFRFFSYGDSCLLF